MSRFGDRLYGARMQAAMTQAELAEKAGIWREMVNRYENGRRTPTMSTLVKLAKALGVKPGRLLTGKTRRIDP
jgi:transcriptional regulator with XRE-family HTH domain